MSASQLKPLIYDKASSPEEDISETIQDRPQLIWIIARWGFLNVFEEFIIFVQTYPSAQPEKRGVPSWIALCDFRCSPACFAPALNWGIFFANNGKMYASF